VGFLSYDLVSASPPQPCDDIAGEPPLEKRVGYSDFDVELLSDFGLLEFDLLAAFAVKI